MKKYICIFAAVVALSACSKDGINESYKNGPVTLEMKVQSYDALTKAYVSGTSDLALDKVQVMVFDNQGVLEATTDLASSGSSLQLDVAPGAKTIWAVGNVPSKINANSLTELQSQEYDLSDNSVTKLIMSKSKTQTITQSGLIEITLDRLACKIVLEKIIRNFSEPLYADLPLTVKRIFLSNVASVANLSAIPGNPRGFVVQKGVIANLSAAEKALLVDEGLNAVLYDGQSYDTVHTFYAYPNGVLNDEFGGSTFHARRTRLVVECEYNGNTCYYPITLPGVQNNSRGVLERNKVYRITTLTLTRPGSPDPDVPDDQVSSIQTCTFSVTAEPWSSGHTYTETFS